VWVRRSAQFRHRVAVKAAVKWIESDQKSFATCDPVRPTRRGRHARRALSGSRLRYAYGVDGRRDLARPTDQRPMGRSRCQVCLITAALPV
jgi:hypothetical protein